VINRQTDARYICSERQHLCTLCMWCELTHTHTHRLTALCTWQRTRVGRYQKKHSSAGTRPDHQTSFINFFHLLRSLASFLSNLRARQSFSTTSVQVSLVWDPLLPTPYISSPSHHLLFTTRAHTIAVCFVTSSIPNLFLSLKICLLP